MPFSSTSLASPVLRAGRRLATSAVISVVKAASPAWNVRSWLLIEVNLREGRIFSNFIFLDVLKLCELLNLSQLGNDLNSTR